MLENMAKIPEVVELGEAIKGDFPLFSRRDVHFLDSAASAQKLGCVLDAEMTFYTQHYANVHRGVYKLSQEASELLEESRIVTKEFINASSSEEIIFTRGTTESINLVAATFGRSILKPDAEIIVTVMEHHANFVPWQQLAKERGLKIHFVGLTKDGDFDRQEFSKLLNERTGLVAISYISNGLGVKLPAAELIAEAHKVGAKVLLDAAQAVSHLAIDVQALDVDFLAFSGHKIYGPTGIGVLYGRRELLDQMPPFMFGGDMIKSVTIEKTVFNDPPFKFEAGTPNIAGAIGLAAAFKYLSAIGLERIGDFEDRLVKYLENALESLEGVRILGPRGKHCGLVCFTMDGLHALDVAQYLDHKNVAVRAGHHCAQPLLEHLKIDASLRASVGIYNTTEDIDALISGLNKAREFLE